ncbi:hypothetical protein HMPREF9629_00648 [Peptoanaerobacter stomatis]|uniref:Uncharacterized protein n=1 Tax=Peptoanaerobacter stomatis TaxID=796937 RepID=G9X2P1_9FIRM|nr:hypothetical protein [Peptoanaerobacter stomatis]EHL11111.1 hypothetical protein HMPREF9629_00648 [Peptoanaerobacter stomatis]
MKKQVYHKAKAKQVYMTQSQVTRALIQKEIRTVHRRSIKTSKMRRK